jgi:hypothetical protein
MFDCFEEEDNRPEELVFLIKIRRNKKVRKNNILYFSGINSDGSLRFTRELISAIDIKHNYYDYEHVKNTVRINKITCSIYKMTPFEYNQLVPKEFKLVRKETWWDRIKVWFSRKVQYFAGYISIERPMKD